MPHSVTPWRAVPGALAAGALALGAVAVAAPAVAAPTVDSVSVSAPASATVGDVIDVDVTLAGADVYAYQLAFAIDDSLLSYVDGSAIGPSGGFDSAEIDGDRLTIVHTRLGTSPGLEGAVDVEFQVTALGAGEASLALVGAQLIGADGESLVLEGDALAQAVAELRIDPAEVPAEPGQTPVEPAPGEPEDEGDATGGAETPGAEPAGQGDRDALSSTGFDAGLLGVLAAAAVVVGGAVALAVAARRRKAVTR